MEVPEESKGNTMMDALQRHMQELLQKLYADCAASVLSQMAPTEGLYCEALWDTWTCLNYTKAGTTAFSPCPPLPTFNTSGYAHRYCTVNGTWEIHQAIGKPWTNLSQCVAKEPPPEDDFSHPSLSYVHLYIAGACLSLIFLTISLIIFCGFRQLRCDRVIIHQNLFISYVLCAICWILYYLLVIPNGDVILANPLWCRLLHVFAQYFTACNFSWMFCESIYLHIIMVHALRTSKKLIRCITITGWGVPIILTFIYAAIRSSSDVEFAECWVHADNLIWIIGGPVVVSVAVNMCVLINLVRLLMTKLKQIPDASQSRKAAKAILILVPLFGIQFLLFPCRPAEDTILREIYLHFMAFHMSTQGIWVSIIFCFCNGEVKSLLRRKWHQHRLMTGHARKNTGFTSSTFVDPYSVVDTSRDVVSHRSKIHTEAKPTDTQEMKLIAPNTPTITAVGEDEDQINEKTKLRDP